MGFNFLVITSALAISTASVAKISRLNHVGNSTNIQHLVHCDGHKNNARHENCCQDKVLKWEGVIVNDSDQQKTCCAIEEAFYHIHVLPFAGSDVSIEQGYSY